MTSQHDDTMGSEQPSGTELRRDIQQTREDLGETVEALARKVDVKTQAREKVAESKQVLRDKGERAQHVLIQTVAQAVEGARQRPLAAGTAFLLGFLLGLIYKKRR
jgi:ElaB/YqjD/DUF883 family membrane-anchored ribosome-binding protein